MERKIYDSLFEYLADADISHWRMSPWWEEKNYRVVEVTLYDIEDEDMCVWPDDTIKINGREYVKINWGEDEESYIPTDSFGEVLYTVYLYDGKHVGVCIGYFFKTYEEAEKAAQEL
jgi:hypothetical protein